IINMGVFVSYGIPQVALGHSFKRGEISELLRYQVETILEAWSDFWRLASLAPRFRFLGNLMLYGAGALIAVPFLMKNAGADDYARHTALIYFWNRLPNEDIELKERWLSRVYDSFMLTRDASLE